jgi:hypothetical protein
MIFKDKDEKAITALLKELDSLVRVNEPQARALLEKKLEDISNHDYRNNSYSLNTRSNYLYKTIFTFLQEENYNNKDLIGKLLKEKGTPLHDATVIGDTVGDPFKDTSSVAMNPIIKFTTLFGLLAMEIAIAPAFNKYAHIAGIIFFLIARCPLLTAFTYQ